MKCIDCVNAEECGTVSKYAEDCKTKFKKVMTEDVYCCDFEERIELETRKLVIVKSKVEKTKGKEVSKIEKV